MRYSQQDKDKVLDLLRQGFNPSQIARMPGVVVPRRAIARWRSEWIKEGKLKAKETPELDILAGQVDSRVRKILDLIDRSLERAAKQDDLDMKDLHALTRSLNILTDALKKLQSPELRRGGNQMRTNNSPNEKGKGPPDLSKLSDEQLKEIIDKAKEVAGPEKVKPILPKWKVAEAKHEILFSCLNQREEDFLTFICDGAKNPELTIPELKTLRDKITPYSQEFPGDKWLETVLALVNRHISGMM